MQVAADKLLAGWAARNHSNVYAMMRSAHEFRQILPSDPLSGFDLVEGDGRSLKRAYHKLAAKLHPDRQQGNSTEAQTLAEEVFKVLTLAYQKEAQRLVSA